MRSLVLMLSLVMVGCAADSKREAPVAISGVMDLSDWDFERDGPVELRGEWLFGWQVDALNSGVGMPNLELPHRVEVPHPWRVGGGDGDPTSVFGFGSYALRLKLPTSSKQQSLDVALGDLYLQGDISFWELASESKRLFMEKGTFCKEPSTCGYAHFFEPVGTFDVGEDLEFWLLCAQVIICMGVVQAFGEDLPWPILPFSR